MEPSRHFTGSTQPPADSFHSVIRDDGSLHPEVNFTGGRHVVIRLRSAIDPGSVVLAPIGVAVVSLVGEHLSRSPPPESPRRFSSVTERRRHTEEARELFFETMGAMKMADRMLGSVTNPETRNLFVGRFNREGIISEAAGRIVRFLLVLQAETRNAQTRCLYFPDCSLPPVSARSVPQDTQIMEIQSNHYCTTGYTTLDALSILPTIREFDPPMLCEMHQYEFQYMMYQLVCPTWPVPNLAEDALRFGPVPRVRALGGT